MKTDRPITMDDFAQGIAGAMIACATALLPEAQRAQHLRDAATYLLTLADMTPSVDAAEAMKHASRLLTASDPLN